MSSHNHPAHELTFDLHVFQLVSMRVEYDILNRGLSRAAQLSIDFAKGCIMCSELHKLLHGDEGSSSYMAKMPRRHGQVTKRISWLSNVT